MNRLKKAALRLWNSRRAHRDARDSHLASLAEIERLKHDISRHMQICNEHLARAEATETEIETLQGAAIHAYRQMQRDLYRVHHSFEGPTLYALEVAMQDAYGSPRAQEELAIKRAEAIERKLGGKDEKSNN